VYRKLGGAKGDTVMRGIAFFSMKSLLRDFNSKVGREDIFKPTNVHDNLYRDSNVNSFRIVNIVT
jgi:hypothetical protein